MIQIDAATLINRDCLTLSIKVQKRTFPISALEHLGKLELQVPLNLVVEFNTLNIEIYRADPAAGQAYQSVISGG